jgi:H+-transporting ATPase
MSIKPARTLLFAVIGTQTVATLIAVYGLFMTSLGWKFAGMVWGYAIVCAFLTDRLKLMAYRILDPTKASLLATKSADLTPEIAAEAYELFQQRARVEIHADQDWFEAEHLIHLQDAEHAKAQ